MFFVVHYGDTDAILLNSNCQCKILLERIKKTCGISPEDTIDIADMQAVVQKLSDAPFNTYGSQYLQYRANYVLVKVFRRIDENGQFCKEYVPLLNGIETVNPDFITRLSSRKVNPDAYSKDAKENTPNRQSNKNKLRNESRATGKPKGSTANLSGGGHTPQKKVSQRH